MRRRSCGVSGVVRVSVALACTAPAAWADDLCVTEDGVRLALADLVDAARVRAIDVTITPPEPTCEVHPDTSAHYHVSARTSGAVLLSESPLPKPRADECDEQESAAAELIHAALDARPWPGPPPTVQPWIGAAFGGGVGLGGTLLGAALVPEARARIELMAHGRLGPWFAGAVVAPDVGGWTQRSTGGRTARLGHTELMGALLLGRDMIAGTPRLDIAVRVGLRGVWLTETAAFMANTHDGTWKSTAVAPMFGGSARVSEPRLPVFAELGVEAVLPVRLGDEADPLYVEAPLRAVVLIGAEFRPGLDRGAGPAR